MAEWFDDLPDNKPADVGHNQPKIELIQDRWKFRASAVGKCPRALLAEMMGMTPLPPPAYLSSAAKEGHMHEAAVVDDLVASGWEMVSNQELVEFWVDDDIFVRGHTDGLAVHGDRPGERRIVEIKSMSDAQYKLWLKSLDQQGNPTFSEHPAYAWQIACYMLAQELPAVYVVKNRNNGMRREHLLDVPPRSGKQILERLRSVIDMYDPTKTLMEQDPCVLACDTEVNQFFCPFPDLHDKKDKDAGLETDDRPITDVVAAAFKDAVERESQAKKAREALRDQLIDLVGASLVQTNSGHRVDITETKPRRKLNKDKAAAEGIDIDSFYEEGEPAKKKSYRVKVT